MNEKEAIQQIEEFTQFQYEDFVNVMVTAAKITEAYRKLYPYAPKDQTYEEIWNNIIKLRNKIE
jgi:hypothetical protein